MNKLSEISESIKNEVGGTVKNVIEEGKESKTHPEGRIARTLEQQTAKIPSDVFLWSALGAMGLSILLEMSDNKRAGNFVATWVPTILTIGLYNKLVKLHGSDPDTLGAH